MAAATAGEFLRQHTELRLRMSDGAARMLKLVTQHSNDFWPLDVVLVLRAEPDRLVCIRFPARVVWTKWNVFPQYFELVLALAPETSGSATRPGWSVMNDIFNFVFETIFGSERNCIVDLLH